MTYGRMQSMLKVLLIGDNVAPKDPETLLATLEMAYIEISNKCTALKLITANKDHSIMREGLGNTYVRMPRLPKDPTEELDIDSELCPAVARIMASYISKDKALLHLKIADEIIKLYESKVRSFILNQEQQGKYDNVPNTNVISTDGSGTVNDGTTVATGVNTSGSVY